MVAVSELKIRWEWEPGESARVREHAATWARIEIWVDADCVTLVEDVESGSSRRSIYCPLYPLAEWIAYNWWSLQADARPAREFGFRWPSIGDKQKGFTRLRRHSIRASGDGFLWPNLLIVPEGKYARIAWRRDGSASVSRPIRFLTQGEAFVDHESVTHELTGLVLEVLTRLAEQGIDGTPLQKEWEAINQATPEVKAYCIAAARLGLDPYSEAEPYESAILRAADHLSGNVFDDFLDAVEPDHIDSALSWLDTVDATIRGSSDAKRQGEVVRGLRREVHRQLSPQTIFPWEAGWLQAKVIRDLVDVEESKFLDVRSYVLDKQRRLDDRGLLAAGASVENFDPIVVIGRSRAEASRRFTLARALWHYLWGQENGLFLVTTAYTDRQKVERAFAAELLAPASGIAQLLETEPEAASSEDLEQVAQLFRVSPTVIQHQVQNQLLSA